MRALVLMLFLSFLSPDILFPQISFEKTYGGNDNDFGLSVQQTTDGGYVIAGTTESFAAGYADVYLIKTDSSGDTLWTRTYGGDYWDEGWSVQQTTDGGYVITGYTSSFGAGLSDVYLIKTNSSGDTLWTRSYGGSGHDLGRSVQQTTDGGYVIAGRTLSFGAGYADVYLIKTDPSGDTLWTRTYGGDSFESGHSVQQTTDGGYVIAGDTWSFGAGLSDVYLIKTNSSGDTLWTKTYGGDSSDEGNAVQQTTDGGYVIAGYTESFSAGAIDVYLIKTDSSGDTLWTRTYGGDSFESGRSVQQTTDGGYVITGYTSSFGAGYSDVYLIKTDSSGDTLWTKTHGGYRWNEGWSVQQTTDGGYVIAGTTSSFGLEYYFDVYLIKTDPDGYVGISDNDPPSMELPRSWVLSQNYPNPFNPTTTISFDIIGTSGIKQHVQLIVYNMRGKQVIRLVDSEYEPGNHRVIWNGRNEKGEQVSSGIYLYTLRSSENVYTKKMVLLK